MNYKTTTQKIVFFFLTKIVIGILVVVGSVALVENAGRSLLDKVQLTGELQNAIIGITQSAIGLISYVLLFRVYEKRQIKELRLATFWKNACIGCLIGLMIQSLVILVIYMAGGYSITRVNSISFLFPGFIAAITAGFVAEILLRGILFRLIEEKTGTIIALIISALFFAIIHSAARGATLVSVLSTSIQAGILFSAVYVFTRSLWLPIFLHFAWDFAEPGIYGGINTGISIEKTFFTSKITGPELLTGGRFGPGNSIQSAIFCLIAALVFLWLAYKKNNFIKPYRRKSI